MTSGSAERTFAFRNDQSAAELPLWENLSRLLIAKEKVDDIRERVRAPTLLAVPTRIARSRVCTLRRSEEVARLLNRSASSPCAVIG